MHTWKTFERKISPVFKLTDLTKLYKNQLKLLGVVFEGQIYALRLKGMLLSVLPDLNLSKFKLGDIFSSLALFCFTLFVSSKLSF